MKRAALVGLACVAACRSAAEFRVGAAKIKITPDAPMTLAGYGSRHKPSEGVARDLYARALALEDASGGRVVIVSADIIGFGPVIGEKIKNELRAKHGLDEGQVLLVGSHTHNGPLIAERALVDHPEQVREKDEWADSLRRAVVQIVGEALSTLAPATLSFARSEDRATGCNRRVQKPDGSGTFGDNREAVTDPDIFMLAVRSHNEVRAFVFTYACHCTSIRSGQEGFYKFHPDYAGVAAQMFEEKNQGAVCLYATGCGADIDPSQKGGVEAAESNGRNVLAKFTIDGGRRVAGPIRIRFRRVELPLERPSRARYEKMAATGRGGEKEWAQEVLGRMEAGKLPASISYPIQVWHFGSDLTLVALAGETCVDYALRLKRELGSDRLWVAGYSNEVMCYVPSERVLGEGGYEAGWSPAWGRNVALSQMAWSGWPAPFAPGVEDRIISAVHALVRE